MSEINLTEKYQVLPSMPPEQFEALKADIAERGVLVPIDVDEQGHILDGHHRYRACTELGVTDFPTVVRPGLNEEERRIFARKSNMLRRHLSRKQVRELIAEQLKDTPNWANNRIAQVLGADSKTVKTVRERLERTSEIPKLDKLIGADGKARPVKQKRPAAIMAANANDLQHILDRIERGTSIEEIQGFLSEQGFASVYVIHDDHDPFAEFDEGGKRAWLLFTRWFVTTMGADPRDACSHVEWLLRHSFKSPAEWMGEEGAEYRQMCGMSRMQKKTTRAWGAYFEEHRDLSLSDVVALCESETSNA
jgi:ParB-like chromosome segregation protein Spo0J